MEQLMRWVVELNTFRHIDYAFLTVFTMLGVGGFFAAAIELLLIAVAGKSAKHVASK